MRRPIFWFLWPAAEPGPVDGDAVQGRWIRVCGRGPWRWAFLIACSAAVVTLSSAALAVVVTQPGLLTLLLSACVIVPVIALLARAWVAGTYVSDRGVKVSRILTTDLVPWSEVTGIAVSSGSHCLGLPIRVSGERIVVHRTGAADNAGAADTARAADTAGAADNLRSATPDVLHTHVETASPDLWLRPQAWSAASDRLRTWHRETRG